MPSGSKPGSASALALPPRVRFELSARTILLVGLLIAGVWLVAKLAAVLLVLVAALMIVGSLNPVVESLGRRKMSRGYAIALVFGIAVVLFAAGLFLTVPPLVAQFRDIAEHEPEIRRQVVMYLDASPLTQALADEIRQLQYGDLLKNSRSILLNASIHAFAIIAYSLAAIFLALYIMIDRDRLRGALFALVPRKHHVRTSRVLLNLETIVGGYIRGQVVTCIAIGVFMFALLLVLRVPNALALSVFGAAMDVLPYLGPLLTIVPAVASAYTVGPWVAFTVFVAMLLYEEFEGRILMPLVYGRVLRLPSSAVFFALLVGGALGGIAGALLSLPIASAILMVIEELRVELPGEAANPAATAAERRRDEREEREYEIRAEDAPAAEAAAIAVEMARERKETATGGASGK